MPYAFFHVAGDPGARRDSPADRHVGLKQVVCCSALRRFGAVPAAA
jgi:hypothetical protein